MPAGDFNLSPPQDLPEHLGHRLQDGTLVAYRLLAKNRSRSGFDSAGQRSCSQRH
jgi:hypothetical protein